MRLPNHLLKNLSAFIVIGSVIASWGLVLFSIFPIASIPISILALITAIFQLVHKRSDELTKQIEETFNNSQNRILGLLNKYKNECENMKVDMNMLKSEIMTLKTEIQTINSSRSKDNGFIGLNFT